LNENYVLTTATCSEDLGVRIVAGEHSLKTKEDTEQIVEVTAVSLNKLKNVVSKIFMQA